MHSKASISSKNDGAQKASLPKKEHRIWSPTEVENLRNLLNSKKTMVEITKILNRTEKSIRRKCETARISSATVYNISTKKR